MKKKYDIVVADTHMTIVSDESDNHVAEVVSMVDQRIREMTAKNKQCSKFDAAVLCAIDFCDTYILTERKCKNLEAQIALYAAQVKALKEEKEAILHDRETT